MMSNFYFISRLLITFHTHQHPINSILFPTNYFFKVLYNEDGEPLTQEVWDSPTGTGPGRMMRRLTAAFSESMGPDEAVVIR
jgi:hypothetical protein